MKVLIIGANGYIGNVVGLRAIEEGWSVTASTRSAEAIERLRRQGMQPHQGSLEDPESLRAVLSQVDAVVYSAYGYNNADAAAKEISTGKSHISWMLESLFDSGKIFLLTSGSGVYPDTGAIVFSEEMPFPASNDPIVIARRNLEKEVLMSAQRGVRSIVLRPPTVYGRAGSFIVPRNLLDHALEKHESVYVEGTENNKWSAVHIDDLADLFVLAMQKAPSGSLFNTGAESGITAGAIATSISRAANLGGNIKSVSLEEARKLFGHWGEWWAINNQCSSEKARQELGWHPHRISMLEDIEHGSYVLSTTTATI